MWNMEHSFIWDLRYEKAAWKSVASFFNNSIKTGTKSNLSASFEFFGKNKINLCVVFQLESTNMILNQNKIDRNGLRLVVQIWSRWSRNGRYKRLLKMIFSEDNTAHKSFSDCRNIHHIHKIWLLATTISSETWEMWRILEGRISEL